MELRSGRRRSSQQLCSPGGGGGPDRISALCDDMLLVILGRLGRARDAARTTVLSRRWRGLFALYREARVREVVFHDVAFSELEATLGRIGLTHTYTAVYCIRTHVHGGCIPDQRNQHSLLRAASRLEAQQFSLIVLPSSGRCEGWTLLGGCFHNQQPGLLRATCYVYLRPAGLMHGIQNYPST